MKENSSGIELVAAEPETGFVVRLISHFFPDCQPDAPLLSVVWSGKYSCSGPRSVCCLIMETK